MAGTAEDQGVNFVCEPNLYIFSCVDSESKSGPVKFGIEWQKLAQNSPIFKGLFHTPFKELPIPQPREAIELVLKFLYTPPWCKFEITPKIVVQILPFVLTYQVTPLLEIVKNTSCYGYATKLKELAEEHHLPELQIRAERQEADDRDMAKRYADYRGGN